MATSIQHYELAEKELRLAEVAHAAGDDECYHLDRAQVHATLALAAVTALQAQDGLGFMEDFDAWRRAAPVTSLIQPKADCDGDGEAPRPERTPQVAALGTLLDTLARPKGGGLDD